MTKNENHWVMTKEQKQEILMLRLEAVLEAARKVVPTRPDCPLEKALNDLYLFSIKHDQSGEH